MSAYPPDRQDLAPRLAQLHSEIARRHPAGAAETAVGAAGVEVRSPWAAGFHPAPIHPEGPSAGGPAPT